jgi:hypothetical protein
MIKSGGVCSRRGQTRFFHQHDDGLASVGSCGTPYLGLCGGQGNHRSTGQQPKDPRNGKTAA